MHEDRLLPEFVAVGEALTDMIRVEQPSGDTDDGEPWLAKPGGSTWNVARAASALGLRSAFAGAVSQCWFGDAIWRASDAAGLDLRFIQRVDRSPLLAMVAQSKPPRYFFVGDASADLAFDADQLPTNWSAKASWVHFGGISLAREPLAQHLVALAQTLAAHGVNISYDPNYRQGVSSANAATFERMCRLASVVKFSDEDLMGLLPGLGPQAALMMVRAWNPKAWLLYTEGAAGAQLLTPEGRWQVVPPSISVVDTVGAGDASIAGLLASRELRPNLPPAEHLCYAVAAGCAACMKAGAYPPLADSVSGLLAKMRVGSSCVD